MSGVSFNSDDSVRRNIVLVIVPRTIGYGLSGRGAILNGDLKDNCSAPGQLAGVQILEVGYALFGP